MYVYNEREREKMGGQNRAQEEEYDMRARNLGHTKESSVELPLILNRQETIDKRGGGDGAKEKEADISTS